MATATTMSSNVFSSLFLVFSIITAVWGSPSFKEGAVNSTIDVNAVVSDVLVLRCTVNDSNSEVAAIESLELLPLPSETDNWEINKDEVDGKTWIEVTINGVTADNKGQTFTCTAIDTSNHTSQLTYHIDNVLAGTTFEEGEVNATLTVDFTFGTKTQIKCTIKEADPEITELTIAPLPPVGVDDYRVIRDGNKWIGMEFESVDNDQPVFFTCKAVSSATTAELHYNIAIFDGIKFQEGATNGSIDHTLVTETTSSIRCTIASADPPVTELSIEPMPSPGSGDYRIIANDTYWIEVEFIKITSNTPNYFQCTAKNNMTTATLDYSITVKDPKAPLFTYGGNDTLWTEIATGSNYTFLCDVAPDVALPPVTSLTGFPPAGTGDNWVIDVNGNIAVEIKIIRADHAKNTKFFNCEASNGVRTTSLFFQNYVGGPPSGIDATVDSLIKSGKMEFSLAVTDRSQAPARNILVYFEGVTNGNVSLRCPRPENYDDELKYSFVKFLSPSLSTVRGSSGKMLIYANNSLGDMFIKEVSIAVPAESSSSADAGKIAAGILVPFFVILGAVIAGIVIYYYWKKGRKDSVHFSKISSQTTDIEDAKSTYGAL